MLSPVTVSQGATLPYKHIKPNSTAYFEKVQVKTFEKCRNNISHRAKFGVSLAQCPHPGDRSILNGMLALPVFSCRVQSYRLVFVYLTNLTFYRKALISSHCTCSGTDLKPRELEPCEEGWEQSLFFFFPSRDLGLNQAVLSRSIPKRPLLGEWNQAPRGKEQAFVISVL